MSTKFNDRREAQIFWRDWIDPTIRILLGECYDRANRDYVQTYVGREWFKQQHNRHCMHPAVNKMFDLYKPDNWARVILEWPHKSLSDPNRLAYTRDERSAMYEGNSDKKALVTSIGKYLVRHWPDVPADLIRDLVAEHTYGGTIEVTDNLKRMVRVVSGGPRSCMSNNFDIRCEDGVERHPYAVYAPDLGWSMAVRTEGDEVLGRCLIWSDPDQADNKGYVRSYKRERNEHSHSGADEAIEAYLRDLGYCKWRAWPDGTPISKIELSNGGYLMPYVDGSTQQVDHDGSIFVIQCDGQLSADSTSGKTASHEHTCEDCGDGFDDGDGYWAGRNEDHHICSSCCDQSYTYAYSRRGNQYYIDSDNTVNVGDEYYDVDYLSDNNIVELHDGEYEHTDNVTYIESEDAYYRDDDEDICRAEDTDRYELTEDCWQCEESGNWYTDDCEDYVMVDDHKYHADHAPAVDEEDEDETETETETVAECVWTPHVTGPTETT